MRLIDADALIEAIWKKHKKTEEEYDLCVDELKEVYCGVVATIEEQPTAYDIEKVVEQLEEEICVEYNDGMKNEEIAETCIKQLRKHAIDIVKAGGE